MKLMKLSPVLAKDLQEILDDEGTYEPGLLITGGSNAGKTTFAFAILLAALELLVEVSNECDTDKLKQLKKQWGYPEGADINIVFLAATRNSAREHLQSFVKLAVETLTYFKNKPVEMDEDDLSEPTWDPEILPGVFLVSGSYLDEEIRGLPQLITVFHELNSFKNVGHAYQYFVELRREALRRGSGGVIAESSHTRPTDDDITDLIRNIIPDVRHRHYVPWISRPELFDAEPTIFIAKQPIAAGEETTGKEIGAPESYRFALQRNPALFIKEYAIRRATA